MGDLSEPTPDAKIILCGRNTKSSKKRANEISSCRFRRMGLRRTRTENLAMTMLAREGVAAIWTLHLAAAKADRDGYKGAATTIIEIADAAEREWLRRAIPLSRANQPDGPDRDGASE